MSLLSDIFQQNQQIAQNPTKVIRTPLQTAYDNYLNAQNKAQDTKADEWGSALGHSINGIAKIIASQVVKNPYERAGATRNLDNFDDRQDAMVRNWALQRMKNRNDYVQQAREQLGLAREDDDKSYNRELTAQQIAYKKAQDEIANKLNEDKFNFAKAQAEIDNQNKADILDLQKKKFDAEIKAFQNKAPELTEEEKLQNEIKKLTATENAKAQIQSNQDLNKTSAEYNAFKSNIENLKNLSKSSGSIVDRSIGSIASIFTGKDNPLTRPNDAMKEVKAQLIDAIYRANGVDGDKISKEQSKMILAKAGMPDSMNLSQSQVNTIIRNIENIYKQRLAGQQNIADSFNSVNWE